MSRIFVLLTVVAATALLLSPRASGLQTSANLTLGATVQLKKVNTVSGGTSADVLFGSFAPGDTRLFLVQKGGSVRYIDPTVTNGTVGTLLNFSTALPGQLETDSEKGLLGVAFHPDFNVNGAAGFRKFYTYSSEDHTNLGAADYVFPESATTAVNNYAVLREWTANAGVTAITGSSRIIMKVADPQPQHNGGTIAFNPVDRYLYWAMGDGGGNSQNADSLNGFNNTADGHTNSPDGIAPHGNGQNRTVALGKMLRINPLSAAASPDANAASSLNGQYQIPRSNPFTRDSNINPGTGQPWANWEDPWLDEIYAYGLRNPYRWSFDRGDPNNPADPNRGKLYVADVGFTAREEVDLIQSGGNYGWVIREGSHQTPTTPNYVAPLNAVTGQPDTLIDPIAEYDHSVGVAIIGGFVYHGTKLPNLAGKYIFGEYQSQLTFNNSDGILLYFDPNEIKAPSAQFTIFRLTIGTLGDTLPASPLLGLGEGAGGEIFALFDNGAVMELVPEPSAAGIVLMGLIGLANRAAFRKRSRRLPL